MHINSALTLSVSTKQIFLAAKNTQHQILNQTRQHSSPPVPIFLLTGALDCSYYQCKDLTYSYDLESHFLDGLSTIIGIESSFSMKPELLGIPWGLQMMASQIINAHPGLETLKRHCHHLCFMPLHDSEN